jgi:membrane protein YdbS with pleckstrin-like domain
VHVRPAWRAVRRRRARRRRAGTLRPVRHGRARTVSGVLMVIALAVLLLSAIGLQYAPEEAHAWLSATHWVLGIALSVAVIWHWIARLRH